MIAEMSDSDKVWNSNLTRMEAHDYPADFLAWLRKESDNGRNDSYNRASIPSLFRAFLAGKWTINGE